MSVVICPVARNILSINGQEVFSQTNFVEGYGKVIVAKFLLYFLFISNYISCIYRELPYNVSIGHLGCW